MIIQQISFLWEHRHNQKRPSFCAELEQHSKGKERVRTHEVCLWQNSTQHGESGWVKFAKSVRLLAQCLLGLKVYNEGCSGSSSFPWWQRMGNLTRLFGTRGSRYISMLEEKCQYCVCIAGSGWWRPGQKFCGLSFKSFDPAAVAQPGRHGCMIAELHMRPKFGSQHNLKRLCAGVHASSPCWLGGWDRGTVTWWELVKT